MVENSGKQKELSLEPIEIGSIITVINGMTRPSTVGKLIDIVQEESNEYYVVLIAGNKRARKYRRKEIALPKEFSPLIDTTLLKGVLKYKKGTIVQVSGQYLYIGGDDIMINANLARKKEII